MSADKGKSNRIGLLFFLAGLLVFPLFTWSFPLFDWDEINFAESAREMIASGNYFQVQIDFRPFWEKPPLFFWMQVVSMKIFGINEFAARFPNAIAGAASLWVLSVAGKKYISESAAWLMPLLFLAGFLPHLYFKSGIIDPFFNLFIFLGWLTILDFELSAKEGSIHLRKVALAGIWTGLATLTKGPVALLVTLLAYGSYKLIFDRKQIWYRATGIYLLVYSLVILSWFGGIFLFAEEGKEIILKFIQYQVELFSQPVAGHEQPFFFHPLIFLVGCFPFSVFSLAGFFLKPSNEKERMTKRFMAGLFITVMILFSLVQTKIIHYSSLTYLPGVFLATYFLDRKSREANGISRWLKAGFVFLAVLLIVPSILAGLFPVFSGYLSEKVTGIFAKEVLASDVAWLGWEWIPGVLLLLGMILSGIFLFRKDFIRFSFASALSMGVFMMGMTALVAPRIAGYTQDAAIAFWRSHSEEKAWLMTGGFKSYAHYFYGTVEPYSGKAESEWEKNQQLCFSPIDRPVYMLSRVDRIRSENFKAQYKNFKRIGEKNGYVFFVRMPDNPSDSIRP